MIPFGDIRPIITRCDTLIHIETRHKFKLCVETIAQLLRRGVVCTPDVEHYWDYVTTTCNQSPQLFNQKGRWMLLYGKAIQDKLMTRWSEQHRIDGTQLVPQSNRFIEALVTLAEAISAWHVEHVAIGEDNYNLLSMFDDIVEACNQVEPDPTETLYSDLLQTVIDFTSDLQHRSHALGTQGVIDLRSVYMRLFSLQCYMMQYICRQRYILQ